MFSYWGIQKDKYRVPINKAEIHLWYVQLVNVQLFCGQNSEWFISWYALVYWYTLFFLIYFLMGGKLLYNVVLVSAIQQCETATV